MAEKLKRQETVEPELVAATTHMRQFSQIHPTKATPGEKLPDGVERSSAGFLIKTSSHKVELCKEKIKKEMDFYQKKVVIAYFVGRRLSPQRMNDWLASVAKEVEGECQLGRDLGHGFFQVMTKEEAIT